MIEWIKVNSSAIRKIGYDSSRSRMYIDFEDSEPYYTYCNVPENIFKLFVSAKSVGSYYHQHIKEQYNC